MPGRCTAMRYSCFGTLALLVLLIVVVMVLFSPFQRHSVVSSSMPGPLWASRP